MSRVGKQPVILPSDAKARVENGRVFLEGKHGKLQFQPGEGIQVEQKDGKLLVSMIAKDPRFKANYGTARATINNMVHGVTKGWKRALELFGVGYNARVQGQNLVLAVGFSHEVTLPVPPTVKCTVNKNLIELESPDKELVGTFAAKVRKVQPPEPYLGKGIKFQEEKIRRKAGKAGKK